MIRDYRATDLDAVIAVWRRSSDLAHPFLSPAFQDQVQEMLRSVFATELADVSVTEVDGEVVGFVAMIGNRIAGLFVDPPHIGKGHGRALVDAAVSARGTLMVEVFERNTVGRRFYERFGFSMVSVSTHEETGEALLVLTCTA